jgi:hypothetical protein
MAYRLTAARNPTAESHPHEKPPPYAMFFEITTTTPYLITPNGSFFQNIEQRTRETPKTRSYKETNDPQPNP